MAVREISVVSWILLATFGRLLSFMFSKSPLSGWLYKKSKVIETIFTCQFCANFWFDLLLISLFRVNMTNFTYIPILSEVLGAVITAWVAWMVETGYKARFATIFVGGDEDAPNS